MGFHDVRCLLVLWKAASRRLLTSPRTGGSALVTFLPAFLVGLMVWGDGSGSGLRDYQQVVLTVGFGFAWPMAGLVMASFVFAEERHLSTLPNLLTKPVRPLVAAVAYTAAAVTAGGLLAGVGAAATWLVGAALIGSGEVGLGVFPAVVLMICGWSAVFVPFGLRQRRVLVSGFLYLVVWEFVAAGAVPQSASMSLSGMSVSAWAQSGSLDLSTEGWVGSRMETLGGVGETLWSAGLKTGLLLLVSVSVTAFLLGRTQHKNR